MVVIAGPTAVGKTDTGIRLAQHYGTEILSADSRQFYRELGIGTAKPSDAQLQQAKHHFIGNMSIETLYGSGHYAREALALMEELFKKHQVLIMVGGSGLYIDAVLNGVDTFEEVPVSLRQSLNEAFKTRGIDWLRQELKERDPAYFEKADIHNSQRMIRALEICYHTGRPYSGFLQGKSTARPFIPVKILINTDRQTLYNRINARVDEMIARGLVEEAAALGNMKHHNALQTVGYKEIFEYLAGKTDLATAIAKIKQHTRNYAKRQLTWFRNRDQFKEFEPEQLEEMIRYIDSHITDDQTI